MAGTIFQTKGIKSYGRYGAVGLELLLSIAVGYYLGHWIDGKLGTRWIALVGFLLGCYAGFRALFRTAKQAQIELEREEKAEKGGIPWADEIPLPDDAKSDDPESAPSIEKKNGGAP